MRKFLIIGEKHDGSHVVLASPDVPRLKQRDALREFAAVREHPEFARVSLGVFHSSKSIRLDKPGMAAAVAKAIDAEAQKLEVIRAKARKEAEDKAKASQDEKAKAVQAEKAKEAALRPRARPATKE